jgi:hypothetical protein
MRSLLRQIAARTANSMAPDLLTKVQMKRLEGLLQRLMGREAGPFVAPQLRTDPGLLQISLRLMQPAGGAIHDRHCGGIRAEALHYRSRRKPRSLTWECNRGISMQKGGQGHLHHTFARNARSLSWSPPTLASCSLKIMQHCRRITIEGIDLIISVRRRIHMIPAQMVPIIHKTSLTRDSHTMATYQSLGILVRNQRNEIAVHNGQETEQKRARNARTGHDSPGLCLDTAANVTPRSDGSVTAVNEQCNETMA